MIGINMKKLLAVLLTVSLGIHARSENVQADELVNGVQSGIAWEVYWDTALNNWDTNGFPAACAAGTWIRSMRGKEIRVSLLEEGSAAEAGHRYFVSIHSPAPDFQTHMNLVLSIQAGHVARVSSGTPIGKTSIVFTNLAVKVPEDVTALARTLPSKKEVARIKKGLKSVVGDSGKTGVQHFFVGPFSKLSPDTIIYWVEEKEFIKVGCPDTDDAEMISAIFKQCRYVPAKRASTDKAQTDEQYLFEDKQRTFWESRWIANCVHDGVLVEIKP